MNGPLTVVAVRAGCPAEVLVDGGPVIVTAVDERGQKVEWRTTEPPELGDRVAFAVHPYPTTKEKP